jgi:hypothetical protein
VQGLEATVDSQRGESKQQGHASLAMSWNLELEIVRLVTPPPLWLIRTLSMKLFSVTIPLRSTPMLCRSFPLSSYIPSYPFYEEPSFITPHRW